MRSRSPTPSSERALTRVEVLVTAALVAILVGIFLPMIVRPITRPQRLVCINNLKHIGLAFRIFSTDHDGQWPMDRAITNQGSREWLADDTQLWRHWLRLSNELTSPKTLLCPSDLQRQPVPSFLSGPPPLTWAGFTNTAHLSYLLGLNAREENFDTILSGDRNLTTNGVSVGPGRLILNATDVVGFSAEIHHDAGNILMADGSVQQAAGTRRNVIWRKARIVSGFITNVWLVP